MAWDFFPDGKLKSRSDDGVPVGLDVSLVDNSDTGDVDVAGTWALSSTGTGFQGTNYRTHAAASGSTDKHTWKLNVPADGKYTVYVRYPAVAGASTAAPYSVSTGAVGSSPVAKPVNQTAGAGTWVSLGEFTFAEATTGSVSLAPAVTGTVSADAVKVVRDNTGETDTEKKDFTYSYDTNGNLLQITDTQPGAKVSDYLVGYNGLNQVAKVEEKKGAALLKTTTYTYNENGAPVTRTFDDAADKDDQFSSYTYDARDLVEQVKNGKSATDASPKISGYTYTSRGETDVETKANGNTVDSDYYLDGLVASQVEKKSNGTLVSQHAMEYSPNGDRIKDTAKVQNADNHAAYLENVFAYTFDPLDRIAKVEKKDATGATVLSTESYTHDPAGNVVAQTVKDVSTNYSYDRNRLLTATTGGSTASYTYDPFGRLSQVSSAGKVIERNTYDGYDRIIKHRQLQDDGTTKTTDTTFDALDRTSSKVEGTKTTNYSYLGLSGEVLSEEVAGEITASYQYSPWGSRLSQVKFKADGTTEDSYYGYNPHSDVETLTSDAGDTRSTYGYTAYGKNDDDRFTGADKPEAQNPGKEPYNVYRFNAKRWDQSSESYDMGFRNYSPGLNRFLTRDTYNGALADLNLGTDPWTSNRYAFAGGNPISGVEVDGHYAIDENGDRVSSATPTLVQPGTTTEPGTSIALVPGAFAARLATQEAEAAAARAAAARLGTAARLAGIVGAILSLGGDSVQDEMLEVDRDSQARSCRDLMTPNGTSIYYYPTEGSYGPNGEGRATGAVACLNGPLPKSFRNEKTRYTPPGLDADTMHRGHLIANQFGGDNEKPENIIPQYSGRNMSDMKKVENNISRRLAAGQTIYYGVFPVYDPYSRDPAVPEGVQIYWRSSNGESGDPYVPNYP